MKQTTELLERFWGLAPADWKTDCSSFNEGGTNHFPCIRLDPPVTREIMHPLYIRLECDMASAEAIVFLWDWLRREGWHPHFFMDNYDAYVWHEGFTMRIYQAAGPCKYQVTTEIDDIEGKTRIEVLVRACVAVLEAKAVSA